jgi:hypothetical protein
VLRVPRGLRVELGHALEHDGLLADRAHLVRLVLDRVEHDRLARAARRARAELERRVRREPEPARARGARAAPAAARARARGRGPAPALARIQSGQQRRGVQLRERQTQRQPVPGRL